ncbi:MAG: hypothetical protein HY905_02205 [Deltaproteobacteria bacterium]|nr:hypothetical protein [Deltaproteobacteria bacterium]
MLHRTVAVLLLAVLAAGTGCESRDPCRKLAERDCALNGWDSAICRDARRRAAEADPFLIEVCRAQLESGSRKR